VAAPDENAALDALREVQSLSGKDLDALITQEIGTPMLGVFSAIAKAVMPNTSDEDHPRVVHLMVLSYLMRSWVKDG
jgi:hypothetical protein